MGCVMSKKGHGVESHDGYFPKTNKPLTGSPTGVDRVRWGTRPGRIFRRTLRDNVMGIMIWGGGYSLLILIVAIIFPYQEDTGTLVSILDGLGILERLAGSRSIDIAALATFEGYLALEAIGWAPIVFSAYLIPQAINATLSEERNGTLDLLLSTPLPRWRFFLEKTAAIVVSLMMILALMLITLIGATQLLDGIDLGLWQAFSSILHILPISLVILAVALLICVSVRTGGTAGGLAAAFVLVSYFIRGISDATDIPVLESLRLISIYTYYGSINTLVNGIDIWLNVLVLLVGLLILGLAMMQFQRRDLGV